MDDNELTPDELKTLAGFKERASLHDIDPLHFAKLLSLALVEQKEGGPYLTASGLKCLAEHGLG